jgi:phosphatidylserine decarboxylase
MPLSGKLTKMTYVPGKLFSVSPRTVRAVPDLFARNERVVNVFDTEFGPMALVLVGAIFVGSMDTIWHGQLTPPYGKQI